MRAAAVILAAGQASRFGFKPKCLEVFSGAPIIRNIILSLTRADVSPIRVVLGHYESEIKPMIEELAVEILSNPQPEAGQNSSLRLGLSAPVPSDCPVIVALADQPLLSEASISALLNAYDHRPVNKRMLLPMRGQQPGNPVIFESSVVSDILLMDGAYGGKEWRQDHPASVFEWLTSDPSYFVDIDTREDLQTLLDSQSRTKRGKAL
jgi:molybdenum cofactor cytidylyltransferase